MTKLLYQFFLDCKIFLYDLIPSSIQIPCPEQEDDRGVRMFAIVLLYEFCGIIKTVSILHPNKSPLLPFTRGGIFCYFSYETVDRHPLDIFFLISGEINIWDHECISIGKRNSEFG